MIDRQQKERGFSFMKKKVAGRGDGELTQLDQLQQSGRAHWQEMGLNCISLPPHCKL